jgi:hypothetical protein
MNGTLKEAFEAASQLPEAEQEKLAAVILDELAADERWQAALAGSESALDRLAEEALAEHREGITEPLDPDKL